MGCKALFIGGIKSGKSQKSETYILSHSTKKPIYLATTEFFDDEMRKKIALHQAQRGDLFYTIEEPLKLYDALPNDGSYVLIECMSMWINNMLYHNFTQEDIFAEIEKLSCSCDHLVFVINDVSCTVVSDNKLLREFVDINGLVSSKLASLCDEVFTTIAGLEVKIK